MAAMVPFMLAGTALSTIGTLQQGKAQQQAAEFESKQMEANAKSVEASGQHAAIARRRETDILLSRAQATAGATGFGAVDPDVLKIIGGITEEGERAFQGEIFESKTQAGQMRAQAGATRYEGAQIRRGSQIGAAATALSGAADAGAMAYFGQSQGFNPNDIFRPGGRSSGF